MTGRVSLDEVTEKQRESSPQRHREHREEIENGEWRNGEILSAITLQSLFKN
jgi:hypothetical protein